MNRLVAKGSPLDDSDGFRRSLGEYATGVTVITTEVEGTSYGITSNSFASVSLTPPLILWSIRRESKSFTAFSSCTDFAVNVLAEQQMDLSQHFAQSGGEKFAEIEFSRGIGGSPLLDKVAATFECSLAAVYEGGDHLILLGEVKNYCAFDRQPLIFAKGRYAVAVDHPDTPVFVEAETSVAPIMDETLLSLLMVRAYSAIANRLEKGRHTAGLGLTLMQARLLKAAHSNPGSTLEGLLPELFLDFNGSRNVLESVVKMGLVIEEQGGKVRLTPKGKERIEAIIEHTRANEEVLFKGIPTEDLETVQRVLARIVSGQQ